MIHEDGKEAFEERQEDVTYLQTMGDDAPAEGAAPADAGAERPDPRQALELFQSALGECDVVLDLVNNLVGGRHVLFKLLPGKPSSTVNVMEQMASMATKRMARLGRQREALKSASLRLQEGAQALRTMALKDNQFHAQVARLQHYWSVRRAPASLGPDVPYVVDLTLTGAGHTFAATGSAAAGTGAGAAAGTAGTAAAPGGAAGSAAGGKAAGSGAGEGGAGGGTGGVSTVLQRAQEVLSAVPLIKGPHGQLRLQLPAQEPPPLLLEGSLVLGSEQQQLDAAQGEGGQLGSTHSLGAAGGLGIRQWRRATQGRPVPGAEPAEVYVGLRHVHDALLRCQKSLLWALLLDLLEGEATAASSGSNWTNRLVRLLAELLASSNASSPSAPGGADLLQLADPLINSLRPIMLEHVLSSRLAPSHVHTPRHLPPPPATLHRLLHDVVGVVSHAMSRAGLWNSISQQVVSLPHVSLRWVPTTRLCSSALRVEMGAVDGCLVVLQDTSLELDGVLCGHHGSTRWGGEGHTAVTRTELPVLLSHVCLGLPGSWMACM